MLGEQGAPCLGERGPVFEHHEAGDHPALGRNHRATVFGQLVFGLRVMADRLGSGVFGPLLPALGYPGKALAHEPRRHDRPPVLVVGVGVVGPVGGEAHGPVDEHHGVSQQLGDLPHHLVERTSSYRDREELQAQAVEVGFGTGEVPEPGQVSVGL